MKGMHTAHVKLYIKTETGLPLSQYKNNFKNNSLLQVSAVKKGVLLLKVHQIR